jgi:hypothetical protein
MARLSEKHLQEHKLIEDDQLREGGHSHLLLAVHIAREHGPTLPLAPSGDLAAL